tara:strand:- start:273 stop:569 length:297 start_codon:yes stop_codon:yes gene_type:complete
MVKLLHKVMRLLGYVPIKIKQRLLREILLLEQENERLIKEIVGTQDENGSLWDMLDEIKKSDIAEHLKGQHAMDTFMDELKDAMATEMIKDFKPVGEA